jgi:hypothetical protein
MRSEVWRTSPLRVKAVEAERPRREEDKPEGDEVEIGGESVKEEDELSLVGNAGGVSSATIGFGGMNVFSFNTILLGLGVGWLSCLVLFGIDEGETGNGGEVELDPDPDVNKIILL